MSMLVSTQSSIALALVNAPLASPLSELLALAVKSLDEDMATARGCIAQAAELLNAPIAAAVEPATSISQGGLAAWQKQRLTRYVDQHIDRTIAIEDMAAVARLSRSYFSRAFHISFGCSPHAYLIECRINSAKRRMLDGNASLGGHLAGLRLRRPDARLPYFQASCRRDAERVAPDPAG